MTQTDIGTNPAIGKSVTAAGIRTNYLEAGEGEPLVLLHGSGAGVSAWANWFLALPELSDAFRVIAPDLPGFGYTERSSDTKYDMKLWVAHLLDFLDQMGIEKANLVGNSFGGGLSLAFTLRHPERVRSLVLMGTPAGSFPMTDGLKGPGGFELTREWVARMLKGFPYSPNVVTEAMIDERFAAMRRPDERRAAKRLFPKDEGAKKERIVRGVPEDRLQRIQAPTLVLHGREDCMIPFDVGKRLFDNIPNSELVGFGHCGHWVQLEKPKQFHTVVRNFVSRDL